MRLFIAIILGKTISYIIKTFNIGGGSAAPGLYALMIEPDLVKKLSGNIPRNVIITGTNGKTTTARILAHLAKESGLKIIRNHTGSNLERGIASALLNRYSLGVNVIHLPGGLASHLSFDLGIWELDEVAFNNVSPKLKPDIIVFLNVFRDQLDRYGEVDTVVSRWCETLKNLSKDTLILVNGDDFNTSKLDICFKGNTYKFGLQGYKILGEGTLNKMKKQTLDFEARDIKLNNLEGSSFKTILHNKPYFTTLPLPGVYHIYDFLAAFAIGHELGLETNKMISSLKTFSPAFGRVEKLPFGYIFLIKNPAGATQVFETIAPQIKPEDRLLIALNDNLADGTDVSWIWDSQFELLIYRHPELVSGSNEEIPNQVRNDNKVFVSGTRAYDLAVRLKYAGFEPNSINVEPNLKNALKEARKGLKGQLFILPTYTALIELQRLLTSAGIKKNYWKEI